MKRIRVAVLYGGRSVEHGVSVNSAKNIFEKIDRTRFDPVAIGISGEGVWHLTNGITRDISSGQILSVDLNPQRAVFRAGAQQLEFDIVFPVLHGTDGEDGSIQGLLKALSLPMVGTGVLGSAVSMSKLMAKRLLQQAQLPVAPFLVFTFDQRSSLSFAAVREKLGLPFMVKSASLGSSVGVTKVKSESDFDRAIEEGFLYDDTILIETFIAGREVECSILGNHPPAASLPCEIVVNAKYEFYTFDAKYVDPDAARVEIPARLKPAETERIRELSLKAYQSLMCEDFARVDLFLTPSGEVFINEINTIPGFTNSSGYPMMWNERGIPFTDLISRLIDLAFERHQRSLRVKRDYLSSLNF